MMDPHVPPTEILMRQKHLYLGLVAVGTIVPGAAFLPFLREHGLDAGAFLQQLFGTPVGSFFGWDVIISSLMLVTFVLSEVGCFALPRTENPRVGGSIPSLATLLFHVPFTDPVTAIKTGPFAPLVCPQCARRTWIRQWTIVSSKSRS